MTTRYIELTKTMIIAMPHEIDHHSSAIVKEEAEKIFSKYSVNNIVFDFSDTSFMDSAGIGLIMGRYRIISPRGGKIYGVGINPNIDKILLISGIYNVLEKIENKNQLIGEDVL